MLGWNSCIQTRRTSPKPAQNSPDYRWQQHRGKKCSWRWAAHMRTENESKTRFQFRFLPAEQLVQCLLFSQLLQSRTAKCFRLKFVFTGCERVKHECNRNQSTTNHSWQQSQAQPHLPQHRFLPSLSLMPLGFVRREERWDVVAPLPHCLFCRFNWET